MDLTGQVERVSQLERELATAQKDAARALKLARKATGLTLRAVQPSARRSIATLSLIERGKRWDSIAARRLARLYEKVAA